MPIANGRFCAKWKLPQMPRSARRSTPAASPRTYRTTSCPPRWACSGGRSRARRACATATASNCIGRCRRTRRNRGAEGRGADPSPRVRRGEACRLRLVAARRALLLVVVRALVVRVLALVLGRFLDQFLRILGEVVAFDLDQRIAFEIQRQVFLFHAPVAL